MSTKSRLSKTLSIVLPAGAIGASFLLALSSGQGATAPALPSDSSPERSGVAARLEDIRAGISEIGTRAPESPAVLDESSGGTLTPTWWGNGGWGRWRGGWGNGGWRWGWHNGGWGNGGWGNGGWHNWPNWNNGWHNYWHNA